MNIGNLRAADSGAIVPLRGQAPLHLFEDVLQAQFVLFRQDLVKDKDLSLSISFVGSMRLSNVPLGVM